jgi:hypothetical protein
MLLIAKRKTQEETNRKLFLLYFDIICILYQIKIYNTFPHINYQKAIKSTLPKVAKSTTVDGAFVRVMTTLKL